MDQSTLVEEQIDDGRRIVERFAADGNPVDAAFWVKTAEDGLWFLYIVSDIIEREGPAAAYRTVHGSLQQLGKTWVSSSEIKIIGPENPIAKDVLALMARYPGRMATRFGGKSLGYVAIEQAHIYPKHIFSFSQGNQMTPEEIGQEIIRLMNRGPGILQPSTVSLKDGTGFSGNPFSLELGTQREMIVSFIEDGQALPRVVRLDEISSIR